MNDMITHDGKGCPVSPKTRVDVVLRDGFILPNFRAGVLSAEPDQWRHDPLEPASDIVAYRVVSA